MKATLALFRTHTGDEELRLYFPTWKVDGRPLRHVTVLPHRCDPSVCEYGDHVHVEVYEDDKLVKIVREDAVTLTDKQSRAITEYLRGQLAVDSLIYAFENLINEVNPAA